MNRKIANKPHPTPDPEKAHGAARTDRGSLARSIHGASGPSEQLADSGIDPELDEPTYDSCLDDLDQVLSQSMEQPDPDPNLAAGSGRPREHEGTDSEIERSPARRNKPPRTSEIFRSVMAAGGEARPPVESSPEGVQDEAAGEAGVPDLGVLDRSGGPGLSDIAGDRDSEATIPWGQIVLLSYASVLTLILIWLFWTGRIPRAAAPEPPPAEKPTAEPAPRLAQLVADTPPPPLPPENITTLGKPIRLGDLQITPISVEARPVELIRAIDPKARRREADCLVLRLQLVNMSKDQIISPLDRALVRERELRSFDPYIATSEGRSIRLFPLALDSEWSLRGQEFPDLAPGGSARTFIAAEPGSANHLADEMTWRLRVRIGVYRSDMMGVTFTKADVRRPAAVSRALEE